MACEETHRVRQCDQHWPHCAEFTGPIGDDDPDSCQSLSLCRVHQPEYLRPRGRRSSPQHGAAFGAVSPGGRPEGSGDVSDLFLPGVAAFQAREGIPAAPETRLFVRESSCQFIVDRCRMALLQAKHAATCGTRSRRRNPGTALDGIHIFRGGRSPKGDTRS